MRKKVLFPFMVAMTAILLLGCPNPVTPPKDTVINLSAITGVTAPVRDASPVTAITATDQYTGTVAWSPAVSSTFAASTVYTATITLTAKTGYTLTGVTANLFTVAGVTSDENPANSGVITAVFPATGAVPASDTVINLSAITGVTAPVRDASPVTTITATDQYTGTVAWSPAVSSTFAASTVYTATITLTAKAGFTLTGVAANSFTVAGAPATNAANSGVVTAVFPATGDVSYTSVNIGTLKYVPGGSFQRDVTAPNISVITQAYRMSQHEITRAQFAAMLTTDPSNTTYSSGTGDPVQYTNWYHAIAFCNKLSIAEGLTPVYAVTGVNFSTLTYAAIPTTDNATWNAVTATWTNNGYRLPTEMEWMWAAMGAPADGQGGGTNTTGYTKAFAGSTGSNAIGDYAVFGYYGSETGKTTTERSNPVGSKTTGANELGLYDMSGNVWEWNWDWYATYPTGTQTDYRGVASGAERVRRGGSWSNGATDCTVADRDSYDPNYQSINFGFRVVRP